jgi:hypothetical protein
LSANSSPSAIISTRFSRSRNSHADAGSSPETTATGTRARKSLAPNSPKRYLLTW